MDDQVPAEMTGEDGPTAEQLEAWRSEPQATASEVAAMTNGRPEADRLTVKAVRTRLDRNSMGHIKVGNLRMVPRSEAIRTGAVRESEWPIGGALPQQHDDTAETPPAPAAVAPGQQPVVIDVSEVIETVAKYAAQAAEGRLLEAQAGERERQEQRERALLEETVHELRTMNKALTQQVEAANEARDAATKRGDELAERVAQCERARAERETEAGDQAATVSEARVSGETGGWWGRLIGRSSPA